MPIHPSPHDPQLAALIGGLVVSCQAPSDSPLRSTGIMLAMARASGTSLPALVRRTHDAGALAFGDLATFADLRPALDAGIVAVGTTLSGYTASQPTPSTPDFDRLRELVQRSSAPVFAEGRYATPDDVRHARRLGADFVVVGTAITGPIALTQRFVAAIQPEHFIQ